MVTVRLRGDLSRSEAREIVHVAREHLDGRPGRVLIDLAGLSQVPEDCAELVDELLAEAAADVQVRYVAIVRSQAYQRTFLPTPKTPPSPWCCIVTATNARRCTCGTLTIPPMR